MHYRVLYIGDKSDLEKTMDKFCNDCGSKPIKNAKCDYYQVENEITKGDIGQIGGEYFAMVINGRWYTRQEYPTDLYVKGTYEVSEKYRDGNGADIEKWKKNELERWDKRAKSLLKKYDDDMAIMVLDTHN